MPAIERGQIYDFDFGPRQDNRQEGRRPALVVQSDLLNRIKGYGLTIVVPLTTQGRPSPTYVPLDPTKENGLTQLSFAKCEQPYTVTYDSLKSLRGKVTKQDMFRIREALKLVLDLD
jgi:mRNA-degrading endonuclease toxin of MazEF toxin-antitoxin module